MAKDQALGSDQDDEEIFSDIERGDDGAPAPLEADSDAVSAAIDAQRGGKRDDLAEMSAAIKSAHFGQQISAPAQPAPAQEPAAPKNDTVPLATFLEVQKQLKEIQRQINQPQQQQPAQPEVDLDELLYTNPKAFREHIQSEYRREIATLQLDNDLNRAADRHSDIWEPAWSSFMERVDGGRDPVLYQRVMASRSPGEEIARWYKENQTLSEIGGDLNSYREKLRQEILAEMQGDLGQPAPAAPRAPNGQFQPATKNVTRLPTSLTRLSGRAADADADDGDGSEEAIFSAGRNRRR